MAITEKWGGGVSRRTVLKATGAAAVVGAASSFPAPFVHASEPVTLRIAGTGVNQFKQLSDKAKEDLGINIQYTSLTSDDVVKRAVTQPSSFDLLDAEYWMMKKIVPSGVMRGMNVNKIKYYDDTRLQNQLSAVQEQHKGLCSTLSGASVTPHTILLGVGGIIYNNHTLELLKELGLDSQRVKILASKLHVHSVNYTAKLPYQT
jgi:hypothetical protein